MHSTRSAEMDRCIEVCQSCHEICVESITHCLHLGGRHAAPEHIQMLMDCAEICMTGAQFMMRNSPMHHEICGACAAVCEACAKSCEPLAEEHQMELCADQCRRCAELCREMAKTHTH
jgi:hypothetical protein